jgi:TonB-linked SusC/RagA family outer membrane protein
MMKQLFNVNRKGKKHFVAHLLHPAGMVGMLLLLVLLGSSAQLFAADNTQLVRGVVVDEAGEPIIGATVRVKAATIGAQTDLNGAFQLNVPAKAILIVSYMGYATQELAATFGAPMKIVMLESSQELEDVVITAFGTAQKKETLTGAIQSVRPDDLIVPTSNLSNAFAGRLAGVIAFQRSGEPGKSGSDFYIRGIATLSGMTSPLIILDGLEVSKEDLDAVDPEIIEGFSILKDATASAMYGTRGANGVMIVKTKSGANLERPIIGVRVETNISIPTTTPKFVDGATYMEMNNEAVTNQNSSTGLFSADQILNTRNGGDPYLYPNVDWYDEIFKDYAINQKANFNIRGGTKKIVYFMNMTFNHETSMLRDRAKEFFSYSNDIDLMKYAFQNNVDFHMTETSTISLHLNTQLSDKHAPNFKVEDIYNNIMASNPVDFPTYYPADGQNPWMYWGIYGGGNAQGAVNTLSRSTNGYRDIFESTVLANLDFEQKLDFLTEGLSFKAKVSFKNWNKSETYRAQAENYYILNGKNPDGTYNILPFFEPSKPTLETFTTVDGDRRMYGQAFFNYEQTFADNHNVGGMVLWNADQFNYNVGKVDDNNSALTNSLPKRKMGYAMRLTYDYAYRYLLEVNAGYNGSENFAKGHRWGFFPSIALGWNLAQEPFFQPLSDLISNLKFRGSYGLVGNDQINDARFIYLGDIDLYGSDYYTTGYYPNQWINRGPSYNRYENPEITWEVGAKLNVGMDLRIFQDLNIVLDVFREIRSNIFQEKQSIPNYFGTAATKVYGNLAKVKNSGFDLAVDYGKKFSEDLSVEFKATFTYAHNVVLEYDEGAGLRPALSTVGQNVKQQLGFISDGLYIDYADIAHSPESQVGGGLEVAPGDIKYVDQPNENGFYDGLINADDLVPIGYPEVPEFVYGFGPSVQWKGWDFSFLMQGVARTSLIMEGFHPFGTQYNRNVLQWIADDYWSASNQNINAGYPRLTKFDNIHNTVASDFWLRDASFLKLKNIEIGYKYKFKGSSGSSARIYVSGTNIWTFAPFTYWDPEMGRGKGLSYPTQRVFNVGIQMTLK